MICFLPHAATACRTAVRLAAHALILIAAPVGLAVAAELYTDGSVAQRFEYDTNVDLSDEEESATGSRSSIDLTLGTRTPAVDLALDGSFELVRFFDASRFDTENARLTGRGLWNWRRATLGLQAGVTRDTTSEVEDVQTARSISANEERLTFDASSRLDYQFTRLQSGGLALSYSKRIFPTLSSREARELDLEEYSFYRTSGYWRRSLAPALGVTGTLGSTYFDSDQEETITGQAEVGADYGLTPAFRVDGSIGPSIASTEESGPLGDSSTTLGAVWDAGLDYQPSADAALAARVYQSFEPQSTGGVLVLRTGLSLTFDYELTRYTSFDLPVEGWREDPVSGDGDDSVSGDGDQGYYARVQPGLTFNVTPQASIETSYRFRYRDLEESGISHAVFLGFRYELPPFLTSR